MDLNCTLCKEQENKSNYNSQLQKAGVMHRGHIPNEMCRDMLKENNPRLSSCLLSVTRREKIGKQEAAYLSQFAHTTVPCIMYTHQAKAWQKKKQLQTNYPTLRLHCLVCTCHLAKRHCKVTHTGSMEWGQHAQQHAQGAEFLTVFCMK